MDDEYENLINIREDISRVRACVHRTSNLVTAILISDHSRVLHAFTVRDHHTHRAAIEGKLEEGGRRIGGRADLRHGQVIEAKVI